MSLLVLEGTADREGFGHLVVIFVKTWHFINKTTEFEIYGEFIFLLGSS